MLRARFEDAAFFFGEDLKQPLEDFRPLLKGTTFQRDLGSLFSKSVSLPASPDPCQLHSKLPYQSNARPLIAATTIAAEDSPLHACTCLCTCTCSCTASSKILSPLQQQSEHLDLLLSL